MEQDQIEKMVLACIDTAKAMLDEYQMVIPFGLRAFSDTEDMKMNCPAEKNPDAGWQEQIETVVSELKNHLQTEAVSATALVTELQSEGERGIGLQIETAASSVLFVYPCKKENEEWLIDEPVKTDQLLASVFEN
ncbi:MAG: hypothetical protein OEY11_01015 [Gammaproteobacteria bacterium]|nr:hypothetical protein [Gammaproteobacteria bacterium]